MKSYWAAEFSLSKEIEEKIAELIGSENVGRVVDVCQNYLGIKEREKEGLSQAEINNKLRAIHECSLKIAKALSDDDVRSSLSILIQKEMPMKFLSRHGLGLYNLLDDMYILKESTESVPKPSRGRYPGSGTNETGRFLVGSLYHLLITAGYTPKRVNTTSGPTGILHQLIAILYDCEQLEIGHGELTGIANEVIESAQKPV